MCTAVTYKTADHYFGRNLDLEYSYHETVTVTPRNYPFIFRKADRMEHHYAMIGMAYVVENYPLYYDATNEKGLSMAGLNFPGNADYKQEKTGKDNIAPFEFIPWILGQCQSVAEARELLKNMNLVKINFQEKLPLSPLHWIIADREEAVTVECVKEGLFVYDNPVGVLTNNPPFPMHMYHLTHYKKLSPKNPKSLMAEKVQLENYSQGMGALGLPGDMSSDSRFVRAVYTKLHAVSGESESESISQFFHILNSVAYTRGTVIVGEGEYDITVYSSCCNTDKGIYYYTTYENSQITGVDMYAEDLDGSIPTSYPLVGSQQIRMEN